MSISRIVNNEEEKQTQLVIDGKFIAGWELFDLPEDVKGKLDNMLDDAVEYGKLLKEKEIREVLGII